MASPGEQRLHRSGGVGEGVVAELCAAGYRGYIGYRIMVQNGFNVTNLAGGYLTYAGAQKSAT